MYAPEESKTPLDLGKSLPHPMHLTHDFSHSLQASCMLTPWTHSAPMRWVGSISYSNLCMTVCSFSFLRLRFCVSKSPIRLKGTAIMSAVIFALILSM